MKTMKPKAFFSVEMFWYLHFILLPLTEFNSFHIVQCKENLEKTQVHLEQKGRETRKYIFSCVFHIKTWWSFVFFLHLTCDVGFDPKTLTLQSLVTQVILSSLIAQMIGPRLNTWGWLPMYSDIQMAAKNLCVALKLFC